jgi:hypothetical protein
MDAAVELLQRLREEWNKKPDPDAMKRCGNLLSQLKVRAATSACGSIACLPVCLSLSVCLSVVVRGPFSLQVALTGLGFLAAGKKHPTVQELMIARDGLEIGALWSIEMNDIPSFERYMAQLRCYYGDYKADLPMSAFQYELTGLNLLSLLAQNRLAEFHTVCTKFVT